MVKSGETMGTTLDALGAQHAELDALLRPLDAGGWSAPTRCEGWTVADVVLHVAQTDQLALASAHGRFGEGLAVLARGIEGTGDVAAAVGVEQVPTDRLEHVARLAWRTLPYAFARDGRTLTGPVEFELRAPSGATWRFVPHDPPVTTITGDGAELCLVAARRVAP